MPKSVRPACGCPNYRVTTAPSLARGRPDLQLFLMRMFSKPYLLLIPTLVACGSTGTVVSGPRDISSNPQEIPFLGPVPVAGPKREICLDFDPPGESQNASQLEAVLIAVDGRRDSLTAATFDRRGEDRVCLIAGVPSAKLVKLLEGTHYRAVQLRSRGPVVHVKAIRWWSGR